MTSPDNAPDDLSAGLPRDVSLTVELPDAGWDRIFPDPDCQIGAVVEALHDRLPDDLDAFGQAQALTVILTDNVTVHDLNRTYRNADKPTNVLTFRTPMAPNAPFQSAEKPDETWAGDIFLARETVEKEAAEQGKTAYDHACHLIVHGFLHLIGYDHETEAGAQAMESREIAILRDLGIPDPYRLADDLADGAAE